MWCSMLKTEMNGSNINYQAMAAQLFNQKKIQWTREKWRQHRELLLDGKVFECIKHVEINIILHIIFIVEYCYEMRMPLFLFWLSCLHGKLAQIAGN